MPDHAPLLILTRLTPAALALATLLIGLATRSGALPPAHAKPLGVALWCTLVYWLILTIRPTSRVRTAFLAALALGWTVELFQLTPIPHQLAAAFPPARWVLGTTFHAPDLPMYAAGAALGAMIHLALRRAAAR